jgi:hypothetical protein
MRMRQEKAYILSQIGNAVQKSGKKFEYASKYDIRNSEQNQ